MKERIRKCNKQSLILALIIAFILSALNSYMLVDATCKSLEEEFEMTAKITAFIIMMVLTFLFMFPVFKEIIFLPLILITCPNKREIVDIGKKNAIIVPILTGLVIMVEVYIFGPLDYWNLILRYIICTTILFILHCSIEVKKFFKNN